MASDREIGEEAVRDVLRDFYEAIGTPAPSPGIERLAFLAMEAAYDALWEQWEERLLGVAKRVQDLGHREAASNPDATTAKLRFAEAAAIREALNSIKGGDSG